MTREETRCLALSKPQLQRLVNFRNDIIDRTWSGIDILFPDVTRVGIGNPSAIKISKEALLSELDRQIAEVAK